MCNYELWQFFLFFYLNVFRKYWLSCTWFWLWFTCQHEIITIQQYYIIIEYEVRCWSDPLLDLLSMAGHALIEVITTQNPLDSHGWQFSGCLICVAFTHLIIFVTCCSVAMKIYWGAMLCGDASICTQIGPHKDLRVMNICKSV